MAPAFPSRSVRAHNERRRWALTHAGCASIQLGFLLILITACTPKVDTEDAYALCDWIEANDPVDCSVEECVTVVCRGENVDPADCAPVVEASEEAVKQITELSRRGVPGTRCFYVGSNRGECADMLVDCGVDAYY